MDFFEVLEKRASVRKYTDDPIDDDTITRLLEAVRSCPTAGNLQAYQVYLLKNPNAISALARAAYDQDYIAGAARVLVFCVDADRSRAKYQERGMTLYSLQDTTIAATFAHLAATALGLGSVLVGAFKEPDVREIIGAPATQRPIILLPLGYSDETPVPTDRRPLDEFVHGW